MILEILLFILLSPGILFTLPPSEKGETSVFAVFVHAVIFGVLLYILSIFVKTSEGFQQDTDTATPELNNIEKRQSARAKT